MSAELPIYTGREPCRTGDPDRFFPGDGGWSKANRGALQECQRCPLIDRCLDYALQHDVRGIWGGTTYSQRRVLRRRMGIIADPIVPNDRALVHAQMREARLAGASVNEIALQFGVSKRHAQRITSLGPEYGSVLAEAVAS